jgi:hypothetical protein
LAWAKRQRELRSSPPANSPRPPASKPRLSQPQLPQVARKAGPATHPRRRCRAHGCEPARALAFQPTCAPTAARLELLERQAGSSAGLGALLLQARRSVERAVAGGYEGEPGQ